MKNKWYFIVFSVCLIQSSCEDFVDVELPDNRIVSETVFTNDETANSAVMGIYNELFKADFANGDFSSVTMLGELAADNFQTTVINDALREFEDNDLLTNNSYNLNLWSSAYNIIYMCNSVIEGLNTFQGVSEKTKDKLMAEAQFVRAFVYFHLVNLYGDIPLIQTTDYRENALAYRNSITEVYELIIDDLESAAAILDPTFDNDERLRANKFTALALLARVHLFLEDWEKAETLSTQVINNSENYTLLNNLDEVFLANSKEAIWQISPAGRGALSLTTNEARVFVITGPPPNSQQPIALTTDFLNVFDEEDLRFQHWVGEFNTESHVYHYPFKYKNNRSEAKIIEYSMAMRLAEQYLIRAEARAHQGKLAVKNRKIGEIGLSYMGGVYNKFEDDGEEVEDKARVDVFAIDWNTTIKATGTYIVGEAAWVWVQTPDTYTQQYGNKQQGVFMDIVQPVYKHKIFEWEDATFNVAARFDYVDWNVGKFTETNTNIGDQIISVTPAISFRPTPKTVFRINYRYEWQKDILNNPAEKAATWYMGFSSYF